MMKIKNCQQKTFGLKRSSSKVDTKPIGLDSDDCWRWIQSKDFFAMFTIKNCCTRYRIFVKMDFAQISLRFNLTYMSQDSIVHALVKVPYGI